MDSQKPLAGQSLNPKAFRQDLHGSAHWMDEAEFKSIGLDGSRGVVLGRRKNGELIRFDGDGHVMVFAPTGAGKGIGFIQPNLAEYRGSLVVLDPKGENAIVSAKHRRRMGQDVIVLDPFKVTELGGQTYNPLSALTYADSASVGPWIECISEALLKEQGDKDQHWVMGARKFLVFLMWWMVAHEPPEKRNLVRLFELVHSGYDLLFKMATVMSEGRSPDPEVARLCRALGTWFLGREEREFSYFESICINQLGWIGDFVWKDVLSGPPSPPPMLKTRSTTIYLVLPFHRLDRYQGWLRLMVADLVTALYDTPGSPDEPVLFLLDEASSALGRMEFLFNAAAAVRGAGARLAFVYQDVAQVEKHYRDAWQSLIANSGVTLFWSVNDLKAADFISRRCGTRTAPVPGNPVGISEPLLRVEAAIQLPRDEIIALFRSASPARFGLLNALTDPRFVSKLDKNATYSKPVERQHQARTGYVPVDLPEISEPVRETEETELGKISRLTGLPIVQLEALQSQLGRLIVKDGELGYLNDRGLFVGISAD